MSIWRNKGDEGNSLIHGIRHEGSLWQLLNDFLIAYRDRTEKLTQPPLSETSVSEKLDAIADTQTSLVIAVADVPFIKAELSLVHGLLADIVSADPEKIKELTNAVRSVKEKLQTSVDSQTKEI